MNYKQKENLELLEKLVAGWLPICRTPVQKHFFTTMLELIMEIKDEDNR